MLAATVSFLQNPESLGTLFLSIAGGALVLATVGLIVRLIRSRRKAVTGEEYLDLLYRQHAPLGQQVTPKHALTEQRRPARKKRRSRSAVRRAEAKQSTKPERHPVKSHTDTALNTLDTWRRALAGGDNTLAAEIESKWEQSPLAVPVAPLISLAGSDSLLIREKAASMLCRLEPDASLPMLLAALETASLEEGEVIGSILEKIGDPRAAEPLLKYTRRQAGSLFGRDNRPPWLGADSPIAGTGREVDPDLDKARSWVRDNLKEKAYDWLKDNFEPLEQGNPQTIAVIETLGELGDERVADILLPLWREAEGSFKETVFDSLIKVAAPELSEELLKEIMPDDPPGEETAPDSEREDNLAIFERLFSSDDEFRRLEAVTSIDGNTGVSAIPLLAQAVEDKSWTVRYAAVEALSHFLSDSPEARRILETARDDSSAKVRDLTEKILESAENV